MSGVFRFKQFNVNQQGCAMKINTDGVLLGGMVDGRLLGRILDIGTGTGVIALMLAQRFPEAYIDAVELDSSAAATATANFNQSPFADRLQMFSGSFQNYLDQHPDVRYDLITSNPPFYIHSLHSPGAEKAMAKHADISFFEDLIRLSVRHLHARGKLWLVLPINTAAVVKEIAAIHGLFAQQVIKILSYPHDAPHREILVLSAGQTEPEIKRFVIYDAPKQYSRVYKETLKDFLTIF
jgi:tRNA1Val (adenine37-N6)-methyltransferase